MHHLMLGCCKRVLELLQQQFEELLTILLDGMVQLQTVGKWLRVCTAAWPKLMFNAEGPAAHNNN